MNKKSKNDEKKEKTYQATAIIGMGMSFTNKAKILHDIIQESSSTNKKKNKYYCILLLSIFFLFLSIPRAVFSSELAEVDTRSTVTIRANVPADFSENIAFVLEQETTQVRFAFALTKDNNYTGNISIVGDSTYIASASFKSSNKYETDLAKKYEIENGTVELSFNVSTITYSIQSEELNGLSNEITHGENEDENEELQATENILNNYLEEVSFMQDDMRFFSFLTTYSGAMFEKYYMEADPMNTTEQWESMKEIDRFNYYIIYYMPYTKMMNYQFENENIFIEELIAQKNILNQIEDGDKVYRAIVDMWKWHYRHWQSTGEFYNFYNYYNGTNSNTLTTAETIKLANEEGEGIPTEPTEAESENKNEINEEKDANLEVSNPDIFSLAKENILTCIIFFVAGACFLLVYLHNRKKNMPDETKE